MEQNDRQARKQAMVDAGKLKVRVVLNDYSITRRVGVQASHRTSSL